MSLSFERWYPLLFAVAAAVAAFLMDTSLPDGNDGYRAGLLSAAISASAIFVGFVATSKSILMALPKEPGGIRQQIHDSNFIHDLANYLNQAMASSLAFCALNIAGFFPTVQAHMSWYSPIWIGLGVFCVFSFWRVGRVMTVILRVR